MDEGNPLENQITSTLITLQEDDANANVPRHYLLLNKLNLSESSTGPQPIMESFASKTYLIDQARAANDYANVNKDNVKVYITNVDDEFQPPRLNPPNWLLFMRPSGEPFFAKERRNMSTENVESETFQGLWYDFDCNDIGKTGLMMKKLDISVESPEKLSSRPTQDLKIDKFVLVNPAESISPQTPTGEILEQSKNETQQPELISQQPDFKQEDEIITNPLLEHEQRQQQQQLRSEPSQQMYFEPESEPQLLSEVQDTGDEGKNKQNDEGQYNTIGLHKQDSFYDEPTDRLSSDDQESGDDLSEYGDPEFDGQEPIEDGEAQGLTGGRSKKTGRVKKARKTGKRSGKKKTK